jgi:hypothetical protein
MGGTGSPGSDTAVDTLQGGMEARQDCLGLKAEHEGDKKKWKMKGSPSGGRGTDKWKLHVPWKVHCTLRITTSLEDYEQIYNKGFLYCFGEQTAGFHDLLRQKTFFILNSVLPVFPPIASFLLHNPPAAPDLWIPTPLTGPLGYYFTHTSIQTKMVLMKPSTLSVFFLFQLLFNSEHGVKMFLWIYQTTRCYIPKANTLHLSQFIWVQTDIPFPSISMF